MSNRTIVSNKAILEAWEKERELVSVGKGTRNWTPDQQKTILDPNCGKAYDENGRAFEGHHMRSAEKYPEDQGNYLNIQFLTREEHWAAHDESWRNPTNWYYDPVKQTKFDFGVQGLIPITPFQLKEPVVSEGGRSTDKTTRSVNIEDAPDIKTESSKKIGQNSRNSVPNYETICLEKPKKQEEKQNKILNAVYKLGGFFKECSVVLGYYAQKFVNEEVPEIREKISDKWTDVKTNFKEDPLGRTYDLLQICVLTTNMMKEINDDLNDLNSNNENDTSYSNYEREYSADEDNDEPSSSDDSSAETEKTIDVPKGVVNLPKNRHASEEKRRTAAENGFELQEGQTWHVEYKKGGKSQK